jgi:hypothetical protein
MSIFLSFRDQNGLGIFLVGAASSRDFSPAMNGSRQDAAPTDANEIRMANLYF